MRRIEEHGKEGLRVRMEPLVHSVANWRLVVDQANDLSAPVQLRDRIDFEFEVLHVEVRLEHHACFGRHDREAVVAQRLDDAEHHLTAVATRQVHDIATTFDECLHERERAGRDLIVPLPIVCEEAFFPERHEALLRHF